MMFQLYKYWLKEFFKFFFVIQLLILVIFVFIDYLSRLDSILNSSMSLMDGLGYILLKVPSMFVQFTPAGILLACITVFSLMNRNNELLAIKSSGISGFSLIKPAFFSGCLLALLMLFLGETIIPLSLTKVNYIKNNVIEKSNIITAGKKDIWIKSDNNLIHANFYDHIHQTISGITVTRLSKNFGLISRIDAKKAVFDENTWILENVIEQVHKENSLDYDVLLHDQKEIQWTFKPDDLGAVAKKAEEMSFFQLRQYVKKVEMDGYDARIYKVDLHAKIAFPFICIIMILAGAGTGMRSFAGHNIPGAIAMGLIIAFMYWAMYGFCLSLGYGAVMPAIASAWITNIFFMGFGVLYLANTE